MQITFKTKDEYLAWTAQWKGRYAKITRESRDAKARRKPADRSLEADVATRRAQGDVWRLRREASAMLEIRKEAKALSWALKLAALAAK